MCARRSLPGCEPGEITHLPNKHTEPREYGLGICNGGVAGRKALFGVGEGNEAAGGGAQGAGARQHGMGICNGEAVTGEALYGIGDGG